jgi:hypothetical protein
MPKKKRLQANKSRGGVPHHIKVVLKSLIEEGQRSKNSKLKSWEHPIFYFSFYAYYKLFESLLLYFFVFHFICHIFF